MSFTIFAAEIVLKSAVAGAQQTQFVPPSVPRVRAQRGRICRRHNRQVNVLREVMSNSIEAIDPRGTHWARYGLLLAVHEVVNHERTIRRSEQLAQPYIFCRSVAIVKRRWAFKKLVILNRGTLWKSPPKRGDSFTRV